MRFERVLHTINFDKMEQIEELREQLHQVQIQLQNLNRSYPVQTIVQHEDVNTVIMSGDQIQLESYKSIPEFSGNKNQYRSWRNQVMRRMGMIENLKGHPKYEAALGIIRAKITGAASNVLTNNKTSYNIDAIIERLDLSYADQRPLYIVEAEMTSIKQSSGTLQEFYDAINQALNLVISKIVMTYPTMDEQKSLIAEAQQKSIRTFIIGLKSYTMRNILYSHKPRTLAEAFTTAQTVYYDNQYLQLDQNRGFQKNQTRLQQQKPTPKFNVNLNCNNEQQQVIQREPINMDPSNKLKQATNWRQPNRQSYTPMNGPQRRDFGASRQQPYGIQKINQLQDNESNPNKGYEGDVCDEIPDDLISNASHESIESNTASTFLSE